MRKLWMSTLLIAVFGLALALGFETAEAASVPTAPAVTVDLAFDLDAALGDGERGYRHGRFFCALMAFRVRRECPACGRNAPEWKNHGEFVSCVNGAVNDIMQGLPDGIPDEIRERLQECATRIRERAAQSEVGKKDWECPTRGDRPEPGDRPNPGRGGGGGGRP